MNARNNEYDKCDECAKYPTNHSPLLRNGGNTPVRLSRRAYCWTVDTKSTEVWLAPMYQKRAIFSFASGCKSNTVA